MVSEAKKLKVEDVAADGVHLGEEWSRAVRI